MPETVLLCFALAVTADLIDAAAPGQRLHAERERQENIKKTNRTGG
jgi:hypothetical protein